MVCRLLALAAALDETSAPTARISEGRPRGGRGGVRTGFCASSSDDDESDASEESDTPEESDMVSRACRTLAPSGLGHAQHELFKAKQSWGDKESPCKAWLVAMRMPTVVPPCQVRHYLRPNVCVP